MADLRKCIGSAKFGIEAHEAPPADFPAQPSQKDGLGRMCKGHWTEYTRALRKAAPSALRPVGTGPGPQRPRKPKPIRTKANRQAVRALNTALFGGMSTDEEQIRTVGQVDEALAAGDIVEGEGA